MMVSLQKSGRIICTVFTNLSGKMKSVVLINGLITIMLMMGLGKVLIWIDTLQMLRNTAWRTIGGPSLVENTKFTLLTQQVSLFNSMVSLPIHQKMYQTIVLPVSLLMVAVVKEFVKHKISSSFNEKGIPEKFEMMKIL